MRFIRLKAFAILILLAALLALALPEFSIIMSGREISYPSVGFSRVGVPSDYPSFTRGYGLFPSLVFESEVEFTNDLEDRAEDEFQSFLQRIKSRAQYANFNDILISGEKTDRKFVVKITIPQHYQSPSEYANWLLGSGEMQFVIMGNQVGELGISDTDIALTIKADSIPIFDPDGNRVGQTPFQNLILAMPPYMVNAAQTVSSISFSNQQAEPENVLLAKMIINGGSYSMELIPHESESSWLRAIPDQYRGLSNRIVSDFLTILQSYLRESEPVSSDVVIQNANRVDNLAPVFNADGGSTLAVSFSIAAFFVGVFVFRKYGFNAMLISAVLVSFPILLTINLMKLLQAPLSIGFIVGWLFLITFTTFITLRTLELDSRQFKNTLNKFKSISIYLVVISLIIYTFKLQVFQLYDFLGVMIVGGVALIVSLHIVYPFFSKNFITEKKRLLSIFRK